MPSPKKNLKHKKLDTRHPKTSTNLNERRWSDAGPHYRRNLITNTYSQSQSGKNVAESNPLVFELVELPSTRVECIAYAENLVCDISMSSACCWTGEWRRWETCFYSYRWIRVWVLVIGGMTRGASGNSWMRLGWWGLGAVELSIRDCLFLFADFTEMERGCLRMKMGLLEVGMSYQNWRVSVRRIASVVSTSSWRDFK